MEIEHADVLHAIVEVEANKLLHDGPDATLGEYLARRSNWAGRHPGAAYAILASYATAMKSLGIDFASLRQPSDVSPMLLPERNVIVRGKLAIVSFPVSSAISRALEKAIPAQHLQFRPRTRDWRITLTQHSAAGLAEFAAEHDFDFGTDLVAACRYYADQSRVLAPKSSATASDFETAPLRLSLYPFQRAGVEYAVRTGRCLIGDEPGLGKTAQAIAAAETLQARPVVVVVPPVVLLNWRREITRWVDGVRTVIVTNRPGTHDVVDTDTGLPPAAADYWIVAYTVLAKPAKRTTKSGREVDDFPVADFIRKRLQPKAVIVDEAHQIKNAKAKRAKAVRALIKDSETRILLSGTPFLNRPVEITNLLHVLDRLEDMGGYFSFIRKFCDAKKTAFGWDASGASNLDLLNDRLRSLCYVRRTKAQVLPDLPAKTRALTPVELSNSKLYSDTERQLSEWLKGADGRGAANAEHLTRIAALRRLAGEGKVKPAIAWIEEFLESGEKLVVFAHHVGVVRELAAHFNALRIDGATHPADRQRVVDEFQSNQQANLVVCNIEAAGQGITLTAASNVAFLEYPWTPAILDQAEDRCHRIGQADAVTAHYLYAPGTIDEHMLDLIARKRGVVGVATDGDVPAAGESIVNDLVSLLRRKHR